MAGKRTTKTIRLKGLRGNYQSDYEAGDVVFRKYKKEWHIYTTTVYSKFGGRAVEQVRKASNAPLYIEANEDLALALKKVGKPLTTINDKIDNERLGFQEIEITYNPNNGKILKHKIHAKSVEDIKTHKELVKERFEHYEKMPEFGAFMTIANSKLTYKLSDEKEE
jgi:hypothetical protein